MSFLLSDAAMTLVDSLTLRSDIESALESQAPHRVGAWSGAGFRFPVPGSLGLGLQV